MLSMKCHLHVRSLEIFPGIGDDTYNMVLYVLGNLNRHRNQMQLTCASCMGFLQMLVPKVWSTKC